VPENTKAAIYMVDACSLIELRRTYPRPLFAPVWKLLEELAASGRLLSVEEVLLELKRQDDEIAEWATQRKEIFLPLDEEIQLKAREILKAHPTLVDLKKRKSGADPFLVAAALTRGAIVVTQEGRSGGPGKVKIPDVCQARTIKCITLLDLLQAEGFKM
jgi:Domain of unknown function (DUF4411)